MTSDAQFLHVEGRPSGDVTEVLVALLDDLDRDDAQVHFLPVMDTQALGQASIFAGHVVHAIAETVGIPPDVLREAVRSCAKE